MTDVGTNIATGVDHIPGTLLVACLTSMAYSFTPGQVRYVLQQMLTSRILLVTSALFCEDETYALQFIEASDQNAVFVVPVLPNPPAVPAPPIRVVVTLPLNITLLASTAPTARYVAVWTETDVMLDGALDVNVAFELLSGCIVDGTPTGRSRAPSSRSSISLHLEELVTDSSLRPSAARPSPSAA